MIRMLRWMAMTALIGIALLLPKATAHETDQFTLPEGRAFADLGPHFNAWIFDAINGGVRKTNDRIRAAQSSRGHALEQAQSPEVIAHDVYDQFPNAFTVIEDVDALADSKELVEQFPGKVICYKEPFTNIYQHVHFPLDPRQVFRIWHAATVMAYGTYFGGDKVGHFVDMGMYYYEPYRKVINKGGDEKAAMEAALEIGTHGLIFSERGMLGYLSAGDYSNADMAANFLGLMFYRNLTEPVMLKGVMQPPMLVKDGDFWKLAPHVRRDSDFFAVFICDHLDEALNPGLFESDMRSDIRDAVLARTERILNRRVDAHGNRRSKAYFDAKLEDMKTYYGQDYGYSGKDYELVTIGNTCFSFASPDSDVNSRDFVGNTPLHTAAWSGSRGAARRLIERRADANATVRSGEGYSPEWGNTPLHYACRIHDREIVGMLITAGANINAANGRGQTPLHMAAGHPEIVAVLLDHGARVDARDNEGRTPLHWAADDRSVAGIDVLLDHSAAVDATDNAGMTPLMRAAKSGDIGAATRLLDHGASIEAASRLGMRALELAAASGSPEMVRLLLQRGAQRDSKDQFGWTAVMAGRRSGNTDVIRLLEGTGASASLEGQGLGLPHPNVPAAH